MNSDYGNSLSFAGVYRRFGRLPVLTGVSGRVAGGGVLLVTGTNGSGKSTLLRCLAGLLAADRGVIEWRDGGRVLAAAERRRRVGYLAPDLAFYEPLTALENLELFARLRAVPKERCRTLLDRVGLPLHRSAGALSSGMTQRLRWAWALLAQPTLLLLDEPFQNLDAPGRQDALDLLKEHLARPGAMAVVANPGALELPSVTDHVHLAA
ncbi:MAG: ATP-binding cassette domain-containing protein [Acidobacteriota bacterium]